MAVVIMREPDKIIIWIETRIQEEDWGKNCSEMNCYRSLVKWSRNVAYTGVLGGTACCLGAGLYFLVDELRLRGRGNAIVDRCVQIIESDVGMLRGLGGRPLKVFGPSDGRRRRPQLRPYTDANGRSSIDCQFYVQGPQEPSRVASVRVRSSLASVTSMYWCHS